MAKTKYLIDLKSRDGAVVIETPKGPVTLRIEGVPASPDGKVSLGIDAPASVPVHRSEIQLRVVEAKLRKAAS